MNNIPSKKDLDDFHERRTKTPSKKQLKFTGLALAVSISALGVLDLSGKINTRELIGSAVDFQIDSTNE